MNMNVYRHRQDAQRLMLMVHEYQRKAHYGENSDVFMGYTDIRPHFVLRSITGMVSPGPASQHDMMITEWQAEEAIDLDNFAAELDSWNTSESKDES